MSDLFAAYEIEKFYDEMFAAPGRPHPHYQRLYDRFGQMDGISELLSRQRTADQTFVNRGVTFTVYSDNKGTEKIFPFDLIPVSSQPMSGRILRPVCDSAWRRSTSSSPISTGPSVS